MNSEIQLSKWWTTESCQRAFARAEAKRHERIERLKTAFAERKAKLKQDVEDWAGVAQ